MLNKTKITASIVLFQENSDELQKAIDSFLASEFSFKLFLVDNSPKKYNFTSNNKINYIYAGKNLGFGKGHNSIIPELSQASDFHLILNPDVYFDSNVLSELTKLFRDETVSLVSPKVKFPDEKMQYTARKYPKIKELFGRFFGVEIKLKENQEYRYRDLDVPFYPDFIHGSFLLFRTSDFIKIGGFDERYFLYMEDVDICRKIDAIGKKKMYYPKVHIYHALKKGSSKKFSLFIRHTVSMIKYFNKWGFKS